MSPSYFVLKLFYRTSVDNNFENIEINSNRIDKKKGENCNGTHFLFAFFFVLGNRCENSLVRPCSQTEQRQKVRRFPKHINYFVCFKSMCHFVFCSPMLSFKDVLIHIIVLCFRPLAIKGVCQLLSLVPSFTEQHPAYEVI